MRIPQYANLIAAYQSGIPLNHHLNSIMVVLATTTTLGK